MNCTFYRPSVVNVREFENIVGKLAHDLYLLENEKHDEWCVYSYFYALSCYAQPLKKNTDMKFFGLAAPESIPSDARVDYFYRPTYLATAFMMKAVLLYPSLLDETIFLDSDLDFTVDTVKETLAACMLGCTGRNFDGAGVLRLKDCLSIFENAGVVEFLEKYPEICPEFTELYRERRALVDSGKMNLF